MKDEYIRRAVVTKVYDGDTITVEMDLGFNLYKKNQHIRLARIDTPELKSSSSKRVFASEKALGKDIQDWLSDLLLGKTVFIKSLEKTSFNRIVCEVWIYIDDKLLHLNQYMIDHGIAREYHNKGDYKERWDNNWFNDVGKKLFLEWKESENEDINVIK